MRRRKWWLVMAGLAVLLVIPVFVLWCQPDRVTDETFGRIKVGMSRGEVRAILGPPDDYRTVETEADIWGPTVGDWSSAFFIGGDGALTEDWEFNAGDIRVKYTEAGVVRAAMYFYAVELDSGLLDNLLWRAKRLWRRWFP